MPDAVLSAISSFLTFDFRTMILGRSKEPKKPKEPKEPKKFSNLRGKCSRVLVISLEYHNGNYQGSLRASMTAPLKVQEVLADLSEAPCTFNEKDMTYHLEIDMKQDAEYLRKESFQADIVEQVIACGYTLSSHAFGQLSSLFLKHTWTFLAN